MGIFVDLGEKKCSGEVKLDGSGVPGLDLGLISTPASTSSLPDGRRGIAQAARRMARTHIGGRRERGCATCPHQGTRRTTRGRDPARRPGRLRWPVRARDKYS
eukprot:scaffold106295_cov76-Phaeocystis_antarctica.AAC.1